MVLTLTISEEDYPQIFKLYKRDRDKKIEEIFKTGYNIHFPNVKDHNKQLEYHTILKSIEDMKNVVSTDSYSSSGMDSRLEELFESIKKLTGIGNNSSKKGEIQSILVKKT